MDEDDSYKSLLTLIAVLTCFQITALHSCALVLACVASEVQRVPLLVVARKLEREQKL